METTIFANSIYLRKTNIFNHGKTSRIFNYIDDVVQSIKKLIDKTPTIYDKFDKKRNKSSK